MKLKVEMETSQAGSQNSHSPPDGSERQPLSERQAEAVTVALADATGGGLPLAEALRAAADEATDRQVADELAWLAAQVEAGRPLHEVLASRRGAYPGYVGAVVQAALRTGRLGEALIELIGCRRTGREMWWSIQASLAYPFLLLLVATLLVSGVSIGVVGSLADLLVGLEVELPYVTRFLVWFQHAGIGLVLGSLGAILAAAILLRLLGGAARWRRIVSTVPLVGVLWYWSGVAEFVRLLAVLVEQGVPLPESLRLAAAAVGDANMREVSDALAAGVERGDGLSQLMAATSRLPASLVPIVRWGERASQLPEAFRVAADMFEGRLQMRAELVRTILPPLIFVFVACGVLLLLAGLVLPMFSLIRMLY